VNPLTADISGQAVDKRQLTRQYTIVVLAVTVFSLLATNAWSQQDSVRTRQDTIPTIRLDSAGAPLVEEPIPIKSYASQFDPRRAMLLSAVLPGAGQVYNRSAWKVPIIYGGFVALGFGIKAAQNNYVFYKDLLYRVLNEPNPIVIVDPETKETSTGNRLVGDRLVPYPYNIGIETLRQRTNRWARDRDFMVMMSILWYVLQTVEAHVDAHLKEFKVNPQLNVSVEPAIQNNYLTGRTSGLSLTLRF
jgi:hypothetical protein